jgi:hypothetical protein
MVAARSGADNGFDRPSPRDGVIEGQDREKRHEKVRLARRPIAQLARRLEKYLGASYSLVSDLHEERAARGAQAAAEADELLRRRGLAGSGLEVLAAALVAASSDVTDADPHGALWNIRPPRFRLSLAASKEKLFFLDNAQSRKRRRRQTIPCPYVNYRKNQTSAIGFPGAYALIEPAECDAYTTSARGTRFFGTGSVRRQ